MHSKLISAALPFFLLAQSTIPTPVANNLDIGNGLPVSQDISQITQTALVWGQAGIWAAIEDLDQKIVISEQSNSVPVQPVESLSVRSADVEEAQTNDYEEIEETSTDAYDESLLFEALNAQLDDVFEQTQAVLQENKDELLVQQAELNAQIQENEEAQPFVIEAEDAANEVIQEEFVQTEETLLDEAEGASTEAVQEEPVPEEETLADAADETAIEAVEEVAPVEEAFHDYADEASTATVLDLEPVDETEAVLYASAQEEVEPVSVSILFVDEETVSASAMLVSVNEELAAVDAQMSALAKAKGIADSAMPGSTPNRHTILQKLNELKTSVAGMQGKSNLSSDQQSQLTALNAEINDLQTLLKQMETVDVYRVYNPNSGEHFYTISSVEKDHLVSVGWKYEGTGWKSPKYANSAPVYRLYNPNAGDHHYTTSAKEKDYLAKVGWRYEGISFYSDQDWQGVSVLRAYNPNAVAGAHHFTISDNEYNSIGNVGWKLEGLGWYARYVYSKNIETKNGQTGIVYYDENDKMLVSGQSVNGIDYYFDPATGFRQSGEVTLSDGNTRFYNEAGVNVTGLQQTSSGTKYFDPSTKNAVKNQFAVIGETVRYFNGSGILQTGNYTVGKLTVKSDGNGIISQLIRNNVTYFNQRDPRWANLVFGYGNMASTGCAPTAMTMLVDALKNLDYTPPVLASLLHQNGYFNSNGIIGTVSKGMEFVASYYGLKTTAVRNASQAAAVLKQGGIIAAAMNPGTFAPYGATHEILVHSYDNGKVSVLDPYNSSLNGSYDLAFLLKQVSTEPDDTQGKGPWIGFLA